jgi:acyl carrier protein
MDLASTIRQFIIDNFLFEENGKLNESTSFLETGIIDSTGILELVTFLEDSFGIIVEDEEMIPENLDSIGNLVGYLKRKKVHQHTPPQAGIAA